jgi:dTDP-4-dehydrorhamnose reductase
MRVLIFGAGGMLGHKLYQTLGREFDVYGTVRLSAQPYVATGLFDSDRLIGGVDAADLPGLRRVIETLRPDCVVNALGVVKQVAAAADVEISLTANAIFPHRLAGLASEFGLRLITVSTDCVFTGSRGDYAESDIPDARDLYGLSKLLGEVDAPNALTLRTSMIGRELAATHGLVEWFLSNRGGRVEGFVNAIYSGLTTLELASLIARVIADHPRLEGIYHVSSDPISKFELLRLLNSHYHAEVAIIPDETYIIDRSLDSTRFRGLTGYAPPPWEEMVRQMACDATDYESHRRALQS